MFCNEAETKKLINEVATLYQRLLEGAKITIRDFRAARDALDALAADSRLKARITQSEKLLELLRAQR